MAITIDPTDTQYDLGEIRLDKETIICEEFEYGVEADSNVKNVTNSKDPIRYKGGKNSYPWSASGIDMEFHDLLLKHQLAGTLFPINVFSILDNGNYNHKATLRHAKISSVTINQSEDGFSIDISGNALAIKV